IVTNLYTAIMFEIIYSLYGLETIESSWLQQQAHEIINKECKNSQPIIRNVFYINYCALYLMIDHQIPEGCCSLQCIDLLNINKTLQISKNIMRL
ncbi:MAG: hypothetical protein LBL13_00505, partial [Bacteroidales bacterium]|nr:hypothetical protein [Bacteroidales bacterium]